MYWIFTEQTLQKLEKGLASDTTINEATKEYGNVLIKTFRAYYETIFPKDKYNVNQSWAKLNLSGYNNYTSGCQQ